MDYISLNNWICEILNLQKLQTLKPQLPSNFVVASEWNSKPKNFEIFNLLHPVYK